MSKRSSRRQPPQGANAKSERRHPKYGSKANQETKARADLKRRLREIAASALRIDKKRQLGLEIAIADGMRRQDAALLVERLIAKHRRPYTRFLNVGRIG